MELQGVKLFTIWTNLHWPSPAARAGPRAYWQLVVNELYAGRELSSEPSLEREISVYLFKSVTALYHFLTLVVPIAKKASLPVRDIPRPILDMHKRRVA